jgi:hypothetical protein
VICVEGAQQTAADPRRVLALQGVASFPDQRNEIRFFYGNI